MCSFSPSSVVLQSRKCRATAVPCPQSLVRYVAIAAIDIPKQRQCFFYVYLNLLISSKIKIENAGGKKQLFLVSLYQDVIEYMLSFLRPQWCMIFRIVTAIMMGFYWTVQKPL